MNEHFKCGPGDWEPHSISLQTVEWYTSLSEGNKACHHKWASYQAHPQSSCWEVCVEFVLHMAKSRGCLMWLRLRTEITLHYKTQFVKGGRGTRNVLGASKEISCCGTNSVLTPRGEITSCANRFNLPRQTVSNEKMTDSSSLQYRLHE